MNVERFSRGFTLIQLLVVVTSLSMLSAVLFAPSKIFSDQRAAALSIARTYDVINAAYEFSRVSGGWPYDDGCVSANATSNAEGGGAGKEIIGFDGVYMTASDDLVNGWGKELFFSCEDSGGVYAVTQDVPKKWVPFIVDSLDRGSLLSTNGDWATVRSFVDTYGNRAFTIVPMFNYAEDTDKECAKWKWSWWGWYWYCADEVDVEVEGGQYKTTILKPVCEEGKEAGYAITSSLTCAAKKAKLKDNGKTWKEVVGFDVREDTDEGTDVAWTFRLQSIHKKCTSKENEETGAITWDCKKNDGADNIKREDLTSCGGHDATLTMALYCKLPEE